MKINIKNHVGYYVSLGMIIILGILLSILISYNKSLQMFVVILTAFFYVLWGVLHHFINHDLTTKIMIEYLLVGSLGIAVALFLLRGLI